MDLNFPERKENSRCDNVNIFKSVFRSINIAETRLYTGRLEMNKSELEQVREIERERGSRGYEEKIGEANY